MIELKGSTWDHTRGYDPLVATAAAYSQARPEVHIVWERRTLQDFAEMSLPELAREYDMVVLDHPWIGGCVAAGSLLPIDRCIDAAFLGDQAANSVGKSHASYTYDGHQWALAVDAAAQVSAVRLDLLERAGAAVPRTWDEVIALAGRLTPLGMSIATPLMHVDCLPTFFSLCANSGEQAFVGEAAVSRPTGRRALEMMRKLVKVGHPKSISWNPPQLLDRMATTDEIAYSPLLFGYTNYSRPGYRRHPVRFGNVPLGADGKPSGAVLGGAGLAISSSCRHPEVAADYAAYSCGAKVQCGVYFDHGGQPGHRAAWLDPRTNAAAADFFGNTLPTLDAAAIRPRFAGWVAVQDAACDILHRFVAGDGDIDQALDELDATWRTARATAIEEDTFRSFGIR